VFNPSSQLGDRVSSGMSFKPDGTIMYLTGRTNNKVYQYTLSTAWDLSTVSYASKTLNNSSQTTNAYGGQISEDGTKFYLGLVASPPDEILQYNLSTAWDLSTGSYSQSFTLSGTQYATSIQFKPDGTKYFIQHNETLYQYSMSTPWDISTSSYDNVSVTRTEGTYSYPVGWGKDGESIYSVEGELVSSVLIPTIYKYVFGTQSDKTDLTNVQDNSIFVETDTARRYWFNGTTWNQELPVTEGLKLWLDASDSSTITTATGVSQWNDKSGQGNNVSQATTASQPAVISANQNGKDIIRFDGSNDVLIRSTYTGGAITQQVYTFIVCKMPSTANGVYGWVYDSDASSRHTFIVNSISSPNHQIYAGTALTGTSVDSTNFKLYSLLFNGSSSTLRRAKTNILSGNAGTANMNGIWLGSDNGGTTYNSNVEIAEILIYDAILSDTDRDNIESYLTNKWGLS